MGGSSRKFRQESQDDRVVYIQNWKNLHRVNFVDWVHGDYQRWGFDSRIAYTPDDGRTHPWSADCRYLQATKGGSRKLLELCEVKGDDAFLSRFNNLSGGQKFLISEKLQGRDIIYYPVIVSPLYSLGGCLSKVNVIGLRDDHIVVQIVRLNNGCDYVLLHKEDGNGYVAKSIYCDRSFIELGCGPLMEFFMEAYISPDNSKVLLTRFLPPMLRSGPENYNPALDIDKAKLLSVKDESMFVFSTILEDHAMTHVYAFDPRFHWRRLAVGKSYCECYENKKTSIYIMDLEKKVKICSSDEALHQMTESLVYSRDGRYLASMVVSRCTVRSVLLMEGVIVYDSDDLSIVRRIQSPGSYSPIMTVSAIFPLFSLDSRYMAVLQEHAAEVGEMEVLVFAVPCDISLQNLCRRLILQLLPLPQQLAQLPLPRKLLHYLRFKSFMN